MLGCQGAPTCRGLVAWVLAAAALPVAPSPGLQQADAERQAPGSESSHPNQERTEGGWQRPSRASMEQNHSNTHQPSILGHFHPLPMPLPSLGTGRG